MAMAMPMLADYAIHLACGLSVLLLMTPWRVVPPAFFRTHCHVILGLLVLAALDLARAGRSGEGLAIAIAAAALGYFAAVAWGLGLPRIALPLTGAIALATAGALVAGSRGGPRVPWVLNASGRLASAFLMGSTLTAMLLGHYYLTAPAMAIDPLRRFVRCMAWGLGARALLAAVGLWLWSGGPTAAGPSSLFLAMRWGMGLAGP